MVVLHALSEYLIKKPPPKDLSLDVDVRIRGRKEIRYHFDPSSAYAARSSRVSDAQQQQLHLFVITFSPFLLFTLCLKLPANLDLEVEARGNGEGILEVQTERHLVSWLLL